MPVTVNYTSMPNFTGESLCKCVSDLCSAALIHILASLTLLGFLGRHYCLLHMQQRQFEESGDDERHNEGAHQTSHGEHDLQDVEN